LGRTREERTKGDTENACTGIKMAETDEKLLGQCKPAAKQESRTKGNSECHMQARVRHRK
jgi:3-deoxy-D-arabino-heptulosonate 7-phosphate (DAHP) synthase